jgi:DNA repair protein RAD50
MINSLEQSVQQINSHQRDIQRFVDSGGEQRLRECKKRLSELDSMVSVKSKEEKSISDEIFDTRKQLSEVKVIERRIHDNLKLRGMQHELDELNVKLTSLKKDLSVFDKKSMTDRYNELTVKHDQLIREVNCLVNWWQRAGLVGEVKQMEDQEVSLADELDTDYKDIDQIYKEQLLLVQVFRFWVNLVDKQDGYWGSSFIPQGLGQRNHEVPFFEDGVDQCKDEGDVGKDLSR